MVGFGVLVLFCHGLGLWICGFGGGMGGGGFEGEVEVDIRG